MEIINLRCNNCGADLEINEHVKFFRCAYCNSSLTIKKSGNAVYTEVLEAIKTNTENLVKGSQQMLLEKEIARLDREWMIEKEKYKISNKHGSELPNENTEVNTIISAIIGVILVFLMLSQVLSASGEMEGGSQVFVVFF